ncbi:MAG: uroporphyrinogen decarboxylase [Alphaproteobacteria bacterium]|nr:uroporphyrinogen decarboxylase [Alphaproteobacteria bacterium]
MNPAVMERVIHSPLVRVLRGARVDPVPLWLMRQAGRYLPEYQQVRAEARDFLDLCYRPELAFEVSLQPVRRYGLDAAIVFADILLVADALGQRVEYQAGEGPVLEPIRTLGDVKRLAAAGVHDRLAPVYETVRRLRASLPLETAVLGFAGAPWTVAAYMVEGRGNRDFATPRRWAHEDAPAFGQLIGLLVDVTAEYLGAQIDAGADAVQLFDSWAGVLPSPAYEQWCIAPVTAIVERVHLSHPGIPVIGFSRTASPMLAQFARESGVDVLSLDTAVPTAWAARELAPETPLQGNLDPYALVTGGAALRTEVERIIGAWRGRPHVFNLGHGIVPETPPEHIAELIALVRSASAR